MQGNQQEWSVPFKAIGREEKTDDRVTPALLKKYDLILVDLFLGANLDGRAYIRLLMQTAPEISVIALSNIREMRVVRDTLACGADAFVPKDEALFLPNYLDAVRHDIGPLAYELRHSGMRRNLLGNLRFWRHHRNYLWHGDKCFHMINHSWPHISSVWHLANDLIMGLIEKGVFRIGETATDEALYCFCMAVWLHDIGHRGSHLYGEPFQIRALHGIISAELICLNPGKYGIYGYDDSRDGADSPYKECRFDPSEKETVLGKIRQRLLLRVDDPIRSNGSVEHYPFLLEKIALLCLFHNSRNPLDPTDYEDIIRRGKTVPSLIYEDADPDKKTLCFNELLEMMTRAEKPSGHPDQPPELLRMVSLLRFIDALDMGKWRVGEHREKALKLDVNHRDQEYLFRTLRAEVNGLAAMIESPAQRIVFQDLFYDKMVQSLRYQRALSDKLRESQEAFRQNHSLNLTRYNQILDYLSFITVQDLHFDLHAVIDAIQLKVNKAEKQGKEEVKLRVTYDLNKDDQWLKSRFVHEANDRARRTLNTHIKGDSQNKIPGYAQREFEAVKHYLNGLIDVVEVC